MVVGRLWGRQDEAVVRGTPQVLVWGKISDLV